MEKVEKEAKEKREDNVEKEEKEEREELVDDEKEEKKEEREEREERRRRGFYPRHQIVLHHRIIVIGTAITSSRSRSSGWIERYVASVAGSSSPPTS